MILKVSPSRVCLDEQTLQLDVLVERLHLWLQTADKRQSNRIRSTARPLSGSPSGALVKSFEFCDFGSLQMEYFKFHHFLGRLKNN